MAAVTQGQIDTRRIRNLKSILSYEQSIPYKLRVFSDVMQTFPG